MITFAAGGNCVEWLEWGKFPDGCCMRKYIFNEKTVTKQQLRKMSSSAVIAAEMVTLLWVCTTTTDTIWPSPAKSTHALAEITGLLGLMDSTQNTLKITLCDLLKSFIKSENMIITQNLI